jgi:signal transduction histidine kinase
MREMMERRRQERLFAEGPPVPGWVALATTEGRFLRGSPGAAEAFPSVVEHLRSLPKEQIPSSAPIRIRSSSGERFTVAFAFPEDERFVIVAAVSVLRMLGPLGHQGTLWAVLVLAMAALGLVAVWFQWRWLVLPLRRQAGQVKELRWGEERLAPPQGLLVEEMHDLGEALSLLSGAAVEKEELQRRYVGDILAAQEEERSRIARDLHDGPLQIISSLIQRVQLARLAGRGRKAEVPPGNEASSADVLEEHLARAEDAAGFALAELRGICDALSPPWIDLGLLQAMEELGNRLARSFGVTVTVTHEGVCDCSREHVLALLRIFQEGASNAVRHGGATHLRLHLAGAEEGVFFELRDDGSGVPGDLDPEKLRAAGHRGVVGMMERVAFFGGTFSLVAASEGGSILKVFLPPQGEKGR